MTEREGGLSHEEEVNRIEAHIKTLDQPGKLAAMQYVECRAEGHDFKGQNTGLEHYSREAIMLYRNRSAALLRMPDTN